MDTNRLQFLLDKYLSEDIPPPERAELFHLVNDPAHLEQLEQIIDRQLLLRSFEIDLAEEIKADIRHHFEPVLSTANASSGAALRPAHRVHFLRRWGWAAAAILVLGLGAYLWSIQLTEKPAVTQRSPVPMQNDVLPGGHRALLTLADGTTIDLDSAADGKLAQQGSASIIKNTDGAVTYEDGHVLPGHLISFNTMSTPRGGQYQLTLSDGTQVWLNAESSITYPTTFHGKERKVSITGEAYFEVTKSKNPFRVDIGSATIEVLGTHFNVNTYKEESSMNTTLLEGRVSIKTVQGSLTLKPGQQGQLKGQQLSLADNPDVEQVMAWKNGLFAFNNATLKEVMQQLSRWYDIDVTYEDGIPQRVFNGKIGRQLTLSQVLKGLSATQINYRIESGNRIVIAK